LLRSVRIGKSRQPLRARFPGESGFVAASALKEGHFMKKIVYAAFAATAAMALAACGSSDAAKEEAAADTVEMPAEEAMPADAATAPADAAATPAADASAAPAADAKMDAEKAAGDAEKAADDAKMAAEPEKKM
jgi:hypothetical protein